MLCGGESLPAELAKDLVERGEELWNMYGPTETTIWSTVARVTAQEERISIGKPIDNTLVYILDAHGQPVPVGVPGELHIGGEGLARGYLNRQELTTEKFIPNPFDNKPGSRLYRTGDLAKWWPNGWIECLGRIDHQVKLRGFRIELGEIESVLHTLSGVKDAVVTVREDQTGEKRLIGYLVTEDSTKPNLGELRSFLKAKLPDYMIPSSFVLLEAFPLTPNAKIDRCALPPPEGMELDRGKSHVAPRTPIEAAVARIWAVVLGQEKVGIHDNFFDLGGHSLSATRVISRLQNAFHVEIPLRRLFESPTVADLANSIDSAIRPGQQRQAPQIEALLWAAQSQHVVSGKPEIGREKIEL
jgi:acyl carrier protein